MCNQTLSSPWQESLSHTLSFSSPRAGLRVSVRALWVRNSLTCPLAATGACGTRVSTSPYKLIFHLAHFFGSFHRPILLCVAGHCGSCAYSRALFLPGTLEWTPLVAYSIPCPLPPFATDLLSCLGIQPSLAQAISLNGLGVKGISHNFFPWLVLEQAWTNQTQELLLDISRENIFLSVGKTNLLYPGSGRKKLIALTVAGSYLQLGGKLPLGWSLCSANLRDKTHLEHEPRPSESMTPTLWVRLSVQFKLTEWTCNWEYPHRYRLYWPFSSMHDVEKNATDLVSFFSDGCIKNSFCRGVLPCIPTSRLFTFLSYLFIALSTHTKNIRNLFNL